MIEMDRAEQMLPVGMGGMSTYQCDGMSQNRKFDQPFTIVEVSPLLDQMSSHDHLVTMEIEQKRRLTGHSAQVSTQLSHPNSPKIKTEPPDHLISPSDAPSFSDAVMPGTMYSSGSILHPTEVNSCFEDGVVPNKNVGNSAVVSSVTTITQPKKSLATNASTSRTRPKNKCSVCGKFFNVRILLKRHLKCHLRNNKSQKWKSLCLDASSRANILSQQMNFKSGYSKSKYSVVLRNLFRTGFIRNQIKTLGMGLMSSNSSCFVCQKWFSYKPIFKLHMLRTHTASGDNRPQVCNYNNNNSSYVSPTIRASGSGLVSNQSSGNRTMKEKKYKCPLCEKSFTQSGKLSSHKKKHTGEKPFHCSVCGKDFALKDHLNIHIKIHTGEKPYPCTLCDKAFRQGGHLRMHMQTHTGIKPHKCEYCDKAFSQKGSLMSHMRTHTGEKLAHQCTMCDKSFRDSTKLNNHVRTHTGEKPFQCSLCDKAFSQSGDLVRHMRTHTGEKPYVCIVCNKQFSEGSNLNKHMRTHTGHRPHECSICHKAFSEGSTLKNHMRIHSGEKPYQCSVCQKEFIQSGDLYKHMRTHTGEKPHSCCICGRAFTESSTLRKHMKTHRKDGEVGVGSGSINSLKPKSVKLNNIGSQNVSLNHLAVHNVNFDGENPQSAEKSHNVNFNSM